MNTRFHRWSSGLFTLFLFVIATAAEAGRPPKDPPPPDPLQGTVFFKYGNADIYQVNSAGTALALPYAVWKPLIPLEGIPITNSDPVPSNCTYDGEHLWLNKEYLLDQDGHIFAELDPNGVARERQELFLFKAVRDETGTIVSRSVQRLFVILPDDSRCDLFDLDIAVADSDAASRRMVWSNDGLDSFISFVGVDWGQSHPDPSDPDNFQKWTYVRYIYKFPLVQDPVNGAPRLEFAGMKRIPLYADTETSGIDWSANGTTVVYGTGFNGGELWTHHQDEAFPTLLQQGTGGGPLPAWSPHLTAAQSRIAFDARPNYSWIEQRTISPSGNDMTTVDTTRDDFNGGTENCWQPMDGSEILKRTATYSRKGWLVDVVRIPVGGGTSISLTSTLSRSVDKQVIAWRHGMELP